MCPITDTELCSVNALLDLLSYRITLYCQNVQRSCFESSNNTSAQLTIYVEV